MWSPRSSRSLLALLVCAGVVSGAACAAPPSSTDHSKAGKASSRVDPLQASGAPAAAARPRIVVLGDSLTAGLGLSKDDAYPALLQRRLDQAGYRYEVVNAGVSGDTSAGGLSRLDWSLEGDVRILVLALGGNDGLRGLPVTEMSRNLGRIIEQAQQRQIRVLLAGMETPTNMGPDYQREFRGVFPVLARRYHVAFLPFLLDGVAGHPELNQPDGIHPTRAGAQAIADHLWPVLEPMLGGRS